MFTSLVCTISIVHAYPKPIKKRKNNMKNHLNNSIDCNQYDALKRSISWGNIKKHITIMVNIVYDLWIIIVLYILDKSHILLRFVHRNVSSEVLKIQYNVVVESHFFFYIHNKLFTMKFMLKRYIHLRHT